MAPDTHGSQEDDLVQILLSTIKNLENQLLAHRERRQRDTSPPVRGSLFGMPTQFHASTVTPDEEWQPKMDQNYNDTQGRINSQPNSQFMIQYQAEMEPLWRGDRGSHNEGPYQTVKNSWIEQGIWKTEWNGRYPSGKWKHQEPFEDESESEWEEPPPPIGGVFGQRIPQPKLRRPKSDEEKRKIAKRRRVREREREASRPYNQFLYQVSKRREKIEKDLGTEEDKSTTDINTKAYEYVKGAWTKKHIWNDRWGILPGMSWKHEEPREISKPERNLVFHVPKPANHVIDPMATQFSSGDI